MMRRNVGVVWPVLALGLLVAGAASSVDGDTVAARPLVIDPESFVPIRSAKVSLNSVKARGFGASQSGGMVDAGPRIMLYRPHDDSVFRANEPVTVHVEFLPASDGSAPNMATLNVRVRKGWFGKDITRVVERYVEGAAIRVKELDFSGHTGNFRFEISIKDYRDRESEAEFRVKIKA